MTSSMAGRYSCKHAILPPPSLNLELHDEYDHHLGTLVLLGNSCKWWMQAHVCMAGKCLQVVDAGACRTFVLCL